MQETKIQKKAKTRGTKCRKVGRLKNNTKTSGIECEII